MEKARTALDDDDLKAVEAIAHTLRGSSGNIGGEVVAMSAARLERVAREGDRPLSADALAALQSDLVHLMEALKELERLAEPSLNEPGSAERARRVRLREARQPCWEFDFVEILREHQP
jgi:HPt (histidine-containing phosphotransfer) domain-containing protein